MIASRPAQLLSSDSRVGWVHMPAASPHSAHIVASPLFKRSTHDTSIHDGDGFISIIAWVLIDLAFTQGNLSFRTWFIV